jgi:hypothetical protein
MYFTDRIFIIVLNLALCIKTLSFIIDQKIIKDQGRSNVIWGNMEKNKNIDKI